MVLFPIASIMHIIKCKKEQIRVTYSQNTKRSPNTVKDMPCWLRIWTMSQRYFVFSICLLVNKDVQKWRKRCGEWMSFHWARRNEGRVDAVVTVDGRLFHVLAAATKTRMMNEDEDGLSTYVSIVIQDVVGELKTVEGKGAAHPVTATGWWVLVYVDPAGDVSISTAGW